ncbi:predicted protein [Naegleria gruberi]|uniref:Predicted protein n=1 Tax=Naegleria gruberi TaxID=5762 RepID=D2V7S0_NAEGR|nr:uncharacterized protein NAEGRDRAFT_64903 [Naegleria gruberi]EFC46920.1 predicted protein [Naegleria gruberi]|eukprot:XP_002679664.1 predicted protein [Naegleria gruberi strain NEG-M]
MVRITDFKKTFTCPKCQSQNDNATIKQAENYVVTRECSSCSHQQTLFIPATSGLIPLERSTKACTATCSCTQFRPTHNDGITCECGHLGSYHGHSYGLGRDLVMKSSLIDNGILSFDVDSCADMVEDNQ